MFEWSDDLTTGVEIVDKQHKKIIQKVNELLIACEKGITQNELDLLMDFLGDYVTAHFVYEEKLQSEIDYPNIEIHKKQHKGFLENFIKLRAYYGNNVITDSIVSETKETLVDWLLNHILKSDKAFAAEYRSFHVSS